MQIGWWNHEALWPERIESIEYFSAQSVAERREGKGRQPIKACCSSCATAVAAVVVSVYLARRRSRSR